MRFTCPRKEAGFTFAELAFGMLILVIAAAVLINHLTVNYQTTNSERDRVFAYTKAQAILAEIQGFVDRGQVNAAVDLDVLDDGVVNKTTLSIQTDSFGALVPPDHVISGNTQRDGNWMWSRRITVQPFVGLNNRNVRYVTVRIYRRAQDGAEYPLADLSAVINSAGAAFPTTQVFDVYLFAVENIPGWWVFMDSIKPFVESMITDLETRNPGLSYRTHWITKASFGRNQRYQPFINDAVDSNAQIDQVYHYPGRMPTGSASTYYYVPDNIRARMNLDGTTVNGYDVDTNPYPYALADFFNHAMRYPEEKAFWDARIKEIEQREDDIAAAIAGGTTPPPEFTDMSKEPTLRLLLEDLYSDPNKYKNALIINLHGELLPMPALRNYSDAAKSPSNCAGLRVVTHPEELRTRHDAMTTDPVRLRVYAYNMVGATPAFATIMPDSTPIVLEVMGLRLVDGAGILRAGVSLQRLAGDAGTAYSAFTTAKHASDGMLAAGEMFYRGEFVATGSESFTRLLLYRTPTTAPLNANRGLAATTRARLYGLDYVPCPVEAARDFSQNLNFNSNSLPKNTARWTLSIPATVWSDGASFTDQAGGNVAAPAGDYVVTVRTRIGTPDGQGTSSSAGSTGPLFPIPATGAFGTEYEFDNLSTTYTWWADSAEDVPITERSQFQGDPRHVPYKDLFNNAAEDFQNGYNWFHDSLANTNDSRADYGSLGAAGFLFNRWRSRLFCDVPRLFEVLRRGLVRSACVYTTLTGWSYYYMGIGNDIGYDSANGYPNSIPSHLKPHGGGGSTGFINTITTARRFVRQGSGGSSYWWGVPWLGELYPDSRSADWVALDGNLPSGTGANEFNQGAMNTVYSGNTTTLRAYGTALNNAHQRTQDEGCTSFFNIGSTTSSFHHSSITTSNGTLTAVGSELANNYGMTFPPGVPVSRPFGLTLNATNGTEFGLAPYSTNRYSASLYRTYLTHASGTGSGLVKLVDPGSTSAAYIVVNGIDKAVDTGTTFVAKYAVLSLAHSFFEAGSTTNTLRIQQLSRVEITSPTDITELINPPSIDIQYGVSWTRWDGLPYTATGTYAESEGQLEYAIMYSNDGGTSWYHVQDDTVATPGTRPASTYLVADAGAGGETYTLPVPVARFPQGSYLLRVDCFRTGAEIHYSYHKTKIFIQR
jgi:hypothetical protein